MRTWCNVHEPPPPGEAQADDDVLEAVIAMEELSLEYHNLNLNGKTIMTDINTALTTIAAKIHTRDTFSDIHDMLDRRLNDETITPLYRARVYESLAWRLDTSIIFTARMALFDLFKHERAKFPDQQYMLDAFLPELHNALEQSDLFKKNETLLELLQLFRMSRDWHNAAQSAAAHADRDYRPRTLSQLLIEEKPMKVSVETRANYEVLANRMAKNDPAKAKKRLEDLLARDQMLAEQRATDNRSLIGAVETILGYAERHLPENEIVFSDLPEITARRLIDAAMATLERVAENDIARTRTISAQMFGRVLDAQDQALADLRAYRERFVSEAGELENNAA